MLISVKLRVRLFTDNTTYKADTLTPTADSALFQIFCILALEIGLAGKKLKVIAHKTIEYAPKVIAARH